MLRRFLLFHILLVVFSLLAQADRACGQIASAKDAKAQAVERARKIVEEIRTASYPELKDAKVEIKSFDNESDYFRTSFSACRFVSFRKMHYILKINPRLFESDPPEEGVRAIIAHELDHVLYFKKRNRLRLFGLVRLISKGYTARFERSTDLQAIARGYAEGLKQYREWLYGHIPAKSLKEKRRDYFSPEEIDAIQARLKAQPELLSYWLKHVPRNLADIQKGLTR